MVTIKSQQSLVLCMANLAIGMETMPVGSGHLTEQEKQIHRDLLGKVKKLEGYDDIYVGAGYSADGEPMFFGMEKLDDKRAQVWKQYADALYQVSGIIKQLARLNDYCQNQEVRKELEEQGHFYWLGIMDAMCPNQQKFTVLFGSTGTLTGINGFNAMLRRQKNWKIIYVAYVSTRPIKGPFKPKKELGDSSTLEEFEQAYNDLAICIGVYMERESLTTEHRGIFKNPFVEIKGTYKNIGLKLHAWAGEVEKRISNKKYMTVYPTDAAAELLHRMVKPGDMYIGVDTDLYPYKSEELRKKFPSLKQGLIGIRTSYNHLREPVHVFDLNVLSKYYTESSGKK